MKRLKIYYQMTEKFKTRKNILKLALKSMTSTAEVTEEF